MKTHCVFSLSYPGPIDGGWSYWRCRNGTVERSCTSPRPEHGGRGCSGPAEEAGGWWCEEVATGQVGAAATMGPTRGWTSSPGDSLYANEPDPFVVQGCLYIKVWGSGCSSAFIQQRDLGGFDGASRKVKFFMVGGKSFPSGSFWVEGSGGGCSYMVQKRTAPCNIKDKLSCLCRTG